MKKILILSHQASLSGAPKSLFELLLYMSNFKDYKFFFLFKEGGPLLKKFKRFGKIISLSKLNESKSFWVKSLKRVIPLYRLRDVIVKYRIKVFNPDLIISNTIVNSDLLKYIKNNPKRFITVVREMSGVIELYDYLKLNDSAKIINRTDQFIAISNSTKKDLIEKYKVSNSKIKVIYNSLPSFKVIRHKKEDIISWKEKYDIPLNAFIVGSCGGLIFRKGPDIFLNLAKKISEKYPSEKIYFLWIGADLNTSNFLDFQREIKFLGLQNSIKFIPKTIKMDFFYNSINVYISTAREEPYGLTLFESGIYKIPCLAFEKSGGPEEILKNNIGILLPYANLDHAAEKILELKGNQLLCQKYSRAIFSYVKENLKNDSFKFYKEIIDRFIR